MIINSYNQLLKNESFVKKIKNILKNNYINFFYKKENSLIDGSIIFPFYHHVFDDEVENFTLQLKFMKNYGDFISYHDSIKIIKTGFSKKDKYFCLSFDDGFKNIVNNVADICLNNQIPVNFFIPTDFIDNKRSDSGKIFFNNDKLSVEFLSWKDCKKISNENLFTIGSHSVNHNLISKLSIDNCLFEVVESKKKIENELKISCEHFAPPVGDYSLDRDLNIIKEAGYKSLSSTKRGLMCKDYNDIFGIKRHHLLANWDTRYLNYFFVKK